MRNPLLWARGLLAFVLSVAFVMQPIAAAAQPFRPQVNLERAGLSQYGPQAAVADSVTATAAAVTATAQSTPNYRGFVLLSDFTPPCTDEHGKPLPHPDQCETPRAVRPTNVAEDTPAVSKPNFLQKYPQMGIAGYNRIADSNENLCREVKNDLIGIGKLDEAFIVSDNEEQLLMDIYNALPGTVKRATAVMTVAQAGATGALCVLSAGLYCIAAILTGVGNIFTAQANKKMQLASIRLSIANILITRLNIWSNRLTLRLDARWIFMMYPACVKLGYESVAALPEMPPVPILPEGFGVRPQQSADKKQLY